MRADLTLSRRLHDILADEAELLSAGRFSELADLVMRKEVLMTELQSVAAPFTAPEAEALHTAARRSERLLAAALRGVKSARARHTAVMRASAGFETYDRGGQRSLLNQSAGRLEKRA